MEFSVLDENVENSENQYKEEFLSLASFFFTPTVITIYNTSDCFTMDQCILTVPFYIKYTFGLVYALFLNYHKHALFNTFYVYQPRLLATHAIMIVSTN
jgi:hypothetical protein